MTLEVKTYESTHAVKVALEVCPLLKDGEPCGHRFGPWERRHLHILREHGPEDVPALRSGGGR